MGFIRKFVTLKAKRQKRVKALIDTGADYCYISSALAKEIGAIGYGETIEYVVGDGRKVKGDVVLFTIIIDRKPFDGSAIVIKKTKREFVIGVKFLQVNSIQIMGERLILPRFPVLKVHRL